MRLIDQIFDDMIIDEMVVKIILPEESHKLNLSILMINNILFYYLGKNKTLCVKFDVTF